MNIAVGVEGSMKRETGERPVRTRHCISISMDRGDPATGDGKAFVRDIGEPGDLPTVDAGIQLRVSGGSSGKHAASAGCVLPRAQRSFRSIFDERAAFL